MSAHTPGPWLHVGNGDVVSALDDSDIACSFLRSDDQHDANARLIAAAPELLEALINLERTSGLGFMLNDPERVASRAAIAKATGAAA